MAKFMTKLTHAGAMLAVAAAATLGSAPASAHDRQGRYERDYRYEREYRGDRYGRYEDARDYRYDRDYRDYRRGDYRQRGYRNDTRYRCSDGSTGTILGAIAGGLLGSSVAGRHGDKTAGVIIGGAAGAVAGRAIDKNGNGCR